ncbi:SusC/RagA family TonB-linked outer membrane protein [Paramuribaculum intestinale]|uniref:SusC/RagA family TonB-linked outer membrane protein n=1 Tax=Paramuribaculum intestinale TaxID=2094151 RepID=UPI0026F3EC20|nr:SusC/RagA family TonB-linked outer membrane protein [Paramuribaculum intestinale]
MLRLSVAMAVLTPCISADAYAQTRSTSKNVAKSYHYSGTVIDEENEPLPGATVLIKGSNGQGTATDADGRFTLSVSDPNCVLMVSYVGMKSMEVKATAGKPIDIRLESSDNRLNEIVVTGYQTLSKERATGSFDIIDKKQLQKATGNIASRLMGAAAGLASTQDLYGNPTFEIRGTSSFSVNSAPLLVVDGFAIEGGFESINPNDVESVTVLKDAAAASIWGAKSANGVIVITTKSGAGSGNKNTVVNVDYSGFYKISPKMNLDYALSRVSSDDLINYEIDTFDKWGASMWWPEESSAYSGGSNVYNLLNDYRLGHITQQQMNEGINRYRGIDNTDQIRKHVLQNPMVLQQNIGVNIQTERSNTSLSVLYQNNHDHWKGDSDNKYMVSVNNRTSVYKWLDFIFNGNFDYTDQKLNGLGGLPGLPSFENLVDANGNPIPYYNYNEWYINNEVPTENFPYQDWSWNPISDRQNQNKTATKLNARAQIGLSFKIWQGLTFDSKVQYELIDNHFDSYYMEGSSTVRDFVNTTSTWDRETDKVTVNVPKGGFLDRNRQKYSVLTVRNQVNFNHTFADKHTVAFVGGVETTDRHLQTYGFPRVYGYNDETLTVGTLPGKGTVTGWDGYNVNLYSSSYGGVSTFSDKTDRYFSAFGNASYTFDNKYTVSGSYRTDASNLITDDPAYRYAPFWSVGAGWQIGKEKWLRELTWLDRLNVRLTYGYNGNVDKSTTFKPLLTTSASPNVITGEYTGSIASYGNPTLRWEKTGTWDFGVDFSLFGSKLYGKIDLYNKLSEDLIAAREISAVNGTTSMKLNNGKIQNRGFEVELGSSLNITPDIAWTGTLRFAYNQNKVKSLKVAQHYGYQLVDGGSGAWVEGEDMNTLWCYEYGGIMNEGSESSPHWVPTVLYENREQVGFNSYLYGDGTTYCLNMGTRVAPWNISFGSTFRIYDFDFSFLLTGKFGHKFMRESFNYPAPTGSRFNLNSKYYEILGCDPNVFCPQPMQDVEARYYFWDRFYPYFSYLATDASHIRMQEISLSYNLPRRITSKLGMKGAQVTVQTNNPFNIYFNGWNEDPEYAKGSPKLQASYTFGLKLHF